MKRFRDAVWRARIWKDRRGQELSEYALMAATLAVAAAFLMPEVAASVARLLSRIPLGRLVRSFD